MYNGNRGLANRQSRMSKFYHCRASVLPCQITYPTRHGTKGPEFSHQVKSKRPEFPHRPKCQRPSTFHDTPNPKAWRIAHASHCPMVQQLLAGPEYCRRLPSCCRRSSFCVWIGMAVGVRGDKMKWASACGNSSCRSLDWL